MNTTKILGEAVGIQRQDMIDRTEEQIAEGLTGAVILGRFKRGRFDKPMDIYQGNIRGQLGHDPKNPDYIAVQDCLDTGVPSIQVLRISKNEQDPEPPYVPPEGVMALRTSNAVTAVTLELQKGTHKIDWGDGTVENNQNGTLVHQYVTALERIILVEKDSDEGGSDGQNTIVMTIATGIKEVIQWWGQGYEVLGFHANDTTSQSYLEKVPKVAPRVFGLEQNSHCPIFVRCTRFNDPNILAWDVSAWKDFKLFFNGCIEFNQPIGLHWDFSNATTVLGLIQDCKKYNQPWPDFTSANIENAHDELVAMFNGASSLDQDFSKWCVANITTEPTNFAWDTKMKSEHMPIWGTCPNG